MKRSVFYFPVSYAILLGIIGVVLGFIYSFGGAAYDLYTTGSLNYGSALAFLALIGMPAILASVGLGLGTVHLMIARLVRYLR